MPIKKRQQAESARRKSADERGRLLREFRKVYNVTLEEMAQRVGLSQPMLTRFETGTRKVSTDAWTRLFIAMDEIRKESKAKFEELSKRWVKTRGPNFGPFALFELPTIEAEMRRIVEGDQSRLEVSKALDVQLPKAHAAAKKRALAHIRKNPERVLEQYVTFTEWRQKLLDLEAQGYVMMPKAVEEERDRLKARVAEVEQELKACQEAKGTHVDV